MLLKWGKTSIINIMNNIFGDVLSVDKHLLQSSETEGNYFVREAQGNKILLSKPEGQVIFLVAAPYGCGPNCVQFQKIDANDKNLPIEGWRLKNGVLGALDRSGIDLYGAKMFESGAFIGLKDFPGHMKNAITRRLRQEDCDFLSGLKEPLKDLSYAIKEHKLEGIENPLIEVTKHGDWEFSAGDAAVCGMLLTARCFALGGRFKEVWAQRFAIEVRRYLHRSNFLGRSWIEFAIAGRMTELQQKFFREMVRDNDKVCESLVKIISEDDFTNGKAFLAGVETTLELIRAGFFNK